MEELIRRIRLLETSMRDAESSIDILTNQLNELRARLEECENQS